MYYYRDANNVLQGPYSETAYEKWYENDYMPAGTELLDQYHQPCLIENVVHKSLKLKTKVMFADETYIMEDTIDRTDLDVTLDMEFYERSDDTMATSQDFTQIEEGVDEVDCGNDSEKDPYSAYLQKMVNIYMERRPLLNHRRRYPDTYVPFEFAWSRWVPQPLKLCEALRGAVHLKNLLQDFDDMVFSGYLQFLNIYAHPCHLCSLNFESPYEMLKHFLSVPHVNRIYSNGQQVSKIDVWCIDKMINEVDLSYVKQNYHYLSKNTLDHVTEPSFFDDVDITTAFESLKSTVALMQSVPLLTAPSRKTPASDTSEYIEGLLFFRTFENDYYRTPKNLRSRRFGATGKTICTYCNLEFDATFLDSFPKHLLTEEHIHNALHHGISRSEMEYWLSFLSPLIRTNRYNRNDSIHQQTAEVSLQEGEFPLCYRLTDMPNGDWVYSGSDVQSVLNFVRNQIRSVYPLLNDNKYCTSCRWCHLQLNSKYSVLRHILYDRCHVDRIDKVSNDDLRRLFRSLGISITMPLFRPSIATSLPLHPVEKQTNLQRLKNVAYRHHKHQLISQVAARSFPMGLVNRCELCAVNIERIEGVLTHFCSEKHTQNLMANSRISGSDIDCWLKIFNVESRPFKYFS